MLSRVTTFHVDGLVPRRVTVEADLRAGLPAFTVVGLVDRAVREARERVQAAIGNCGLKFPDNRVTVNLAPASLHKHGPGFDLAIACAILAAGGQVESGRLDRVGIWGELALSGELRPVRGALAVAEGARDAGLDGLILCAESAAEAALVDGITVHGARSLADVVRILAGDPGTGSRPGQPSAVDAGAERPLDLADVRGHGAVIESLTIAAAGGHNILLNGPPGTGKTMLARRVPSILPPLAGAEAVEVTRIQGVAGLRVSGLARERPFRAPHHTLSASALVGGGAIPRPGEITLAHRGVLFLDELPEFPRVVLDTLRQPLEDGRIVVVRGQQTAVFPARFMLVAAMNPCPCGYAGDGERCRCLDSDHLRYRRRLSGPLLDRFDVVTQVPRPSREELAAGPATTSAATRERVTRARAMQEARAARTGAPCNAELDARAVRECVRLDGPSTAALDRAYGSGMLSPRGRHRTLRLARTLADLDGRDDVGVGDVLAALGLRSDVEELVA